MNLWCGLHSCLCLREISSVVEHWLPKPRVVGSNPIFRSIFGVRNVAQLVAHYVRDVGVGRSSRLIPTLFQNNSDKHGCLSLLFFVAGIAWMQALFRLLISALCAPRHILLWLLRRRRPPFSSPRSSRSCG